MITAKTLRISIVAVIVLAIGAGGASAQTIAPTPFQTVFNNSGAIVNNACVWTYVAGTSTPAATYPTAADASALTNANSNPIRSDSAGRFTAFLVNGSSYKFVYEASCTPPSHGTVYRTADNILAVPSSNVNLDLTGTAGESILAGDVVYLSDGSGSTVAGQWYRADSDLAYASTLAPMVGIAPSAVASAAVGTFRISGRVTGLSALTVGAPHYVSSTTGGLTASAPALGRFVGVADSATTIDIAPNPFIATTGDDVLGTAGEALTAGNVVYLSDGTGSLTAGRWYKADADNGYSSSGAPIVGVVPANISSGAVGLVRTAGRVTSLSGLTAGATYYTSATAGALTATAPLGARFVGVADSTTTLVLGSAPRASAAPGVCTCRLTLTSGTAVTVSDVTDSNHVYLTPYMGATVTLYDGARWSEYTLTELDLNLTNDTISSGTNYDVFVYVTGGALTLQRVAWTNDTTRATALTTVNGASVKSGDTGKLFVGMIRGSASNATTDSLSKRFVWNMFNRKRRQMEYLPTTDSWTQANNTWRQGVNGATAAKLEFVIGLNEEQVQAKVLAYSTDAGNNQRSVAIGLDSITVPNGIAGHGRIGYQGSGGQTIADYEGYPGIGYHYTAWLEAGNNTSTTTWYGDNGTPTFMQNGLFGTVVQ